MSRMEVNKGRFVLLCSNVQFFAENFITDVEHPYTDAESQFRDECFEHGFEVINDKVYGIEWVIKKGDPDEGFADVHVDHNGNILFHTNHYNGSQSLVEVVEEAIERDLRGLQNDS